MSHVFYLFFSIFSSAAQQPLVVDVQERETSGIINGSFHIWGSEKVSTQQDGGHDAIATVPQEMAIGTYRLASLSSSDMCAVVSEPIMVINTV